MNKIYKVVWSKVKNCYVVASELAKNVISGSVKSAKVGTAPMARGLALGALIAFVITGNAWASDETIEGNLTVKGNLTVNGMPIVFDNGLAIFEGATADGWSAIAIGEYAEATGDVSISLGAYASATGDSSMAFGDGASASGACSVALGVGSSASGYNSMALGVGSSASDDNSMALGAAASASGGSAMALGRLASATGDSSMAFGDGASASGDSSMALGRESSVSGYYSVALGANAVSSHENSVAIGYESVTHDDDTVSFGHKEGDLVYGSSSDKTYKSDYYRRLTNVQDGYDIHDAATVGQLNGLWGDLMDFIYETEEALQAGINANKEAIDGLQTDVAANERAIEAEVDRATQAEATLQAGINTNKEAIEAGGTGTNKEAIEAEVDRATQAEATLQAGINTNAEAIEAEVQRATQAEATLQAGINTNAEAIDGLNQRLGKMNGKINKVGAGAAALAALHPLDFDPDDKLSFSAGVGNYGGETATALGAFYRPTEKVMISAAGTMGNGENMVNMGVTFALDKTNNVSNSRAAMAREIVDLRAHVARQEQALARQDQQIAQLVAMVNQLTGNTMSHEVNKDIIFPDIPENHWAYEYIHSLAAKGIIEGYPDGNFGGDRTMTRYEFATMLFKAMQKGVVLSEQIRQEFNAELGRIRVDRIKGADNDANKIERVRVNDYEEHDDYGCKIVQVKAGA